jgi:uncharacterized protein
MVSVEDASKVQTMGAAVDGAGGTVSDDPANHRLVWNRGHDEAELVYRRSGERLFLIHTEVPDALAGHGVAGQLVQAAVDWARRDKLIVIPWCPYARKWLQEHPGTAGKLRIDWKSQPSR